VSSYPQEMKGENARCYGTQVVALLSSYPPEVVAKLAEPVNGIVGKKKFLPSVSELKDEADKLMNFPTRMVEINDAEVKQLAERKGKEDA
jgi:hypothetical protein